VGGKYLHLVFALSLPGLGVWDLADFLQKYCVLSIATRVQIRTRIPTATVERIHLLLATVDSYVTLLPLLNIIDKYQVAASKNTLY
jgi:hypothetical protein